MATWMCTVVTLELAALLISMCCGKSLAKLVKTAGLCKGLSACFMLSYKKNILGKPLHAVELKLLFLDH